jgi:hypothetical protein
MKIKICALGVLFMGTLTAAEPAETRIGLRCIGHLREPASTDLNEDHYVIDLERRKIIHRDPFSGDTITTYALSVRPRSYWGERQEDTRNNAGFIVHHYETVSISREDGSISSSMMSTNTMNPRNPVTSSLEWVGRCERENPDLRKGLKF